MASKSKVAKSKKQRKTRKKQPSMWPWLIGAAVVAVIVGPLIFNRVQSSNLPGESFRSQGNAHVQLGSAPEFEYNSEPPTSGPHTPDLAGFGSYDYIVPDERIIHSMEDGGVVMWYAYGTPEENEEHIRALEDIAQGYRRVVIAPRENMETPYVLTAWTRLQRFDEIDETGMREFLEAFEGIDHHAG